MAHNFIDNSSTLVFRCRAIAFAQDLWCHRTSKCHTIWRNFVISHYVDDCIPIRHASTCMRCVTNSHGFLLDVTKIFVNAGRIFKQDFSPIPKITCFAWRHLLHVIHECMWYAWMLYNYRLYYDWYASQPRITLYVLHRFSFYVKSRLQSDINMTRYFHYDMVFIALNILRWFIILPYPNNRVYYGLISNLPLSVVLMLWTW